MLGGTKHAELRYMIVLIVSTIEHTICIQNVAPINSVIALMKKFASETLAAFSQKKQNLILLKTMGFEQYGF